MNSFFIFLMKLHHPSRPTREKVTDNAQTNFRAEKLVLLREYMIQLKALIKILKQHAACGKKKRLKSRIRNKHIFLFYLFAMDTA